tara:strand:- start:42 stop:635 length:594 start_codon:yes stop_codon:yes gene_type:complete
MPDPKTSQQIMDRVLRIKPVFAKANNKEGYAYLNSRFRTDLNVKNPMSGYSGRSSNNQDKFNTDQKLKQYYGGNTTSRSSANRAAKTSSKLHTMLNNKLYQASKLYATNPDRANRQFSKAMSKANSMYEQITKEVGVNSVIATNTFKMKNKFSGAFTNPQMSKKPLQTALLKDEVSYKMSNVKRGSIYDQYLKNQKK